MGRPRAAHLFLFFNGPGQKSPFHFFLEERESQLHYIIIIKAENENEILFLKSLQRFRNLNDECKSTVPSIPIREFTWDWWMLLLLFYLNLNSWFFLIFIGGECLQFADSTPATNNLLGSEADSQRTLYISRGWISCEDLIIIFFFRYIFEARVLADPILNLMANSIWCMWKAQNFVFHFLEIILRVDIIWTIFAYLFVSVWVVGCNGYVMKSFFYLVQLSICHRDLSDWDQVQRWNSLCCWYGRLDSEICLSQFYF